MNAVPLPRQGVLDATEKRTPLSGSHYVLVPEVVTSATSNFLTSARGRVDATVRTRIVATAGPCVFPHRPAAGAFVEIDEGRLTVGLMVPLMTALLPSFTQRCGLWLGLQQRMPRSACPR